MRVKRRRRVDGRVVSMMVTATVTLLLAACVHRFWEPRAPERSFTPQDLLIDQEIVPPGWELTEALFPTGDDLCTTECATIGFEVADDESWIEYGGHDVYRYRSTGIARRTFAKVYLSATRLQASASGWTYRSSVAEQSHFGCGNMAGNVGVYCEWGAQYEEYIVVFGARVPPGEASLAGIEQMEEVVRAIEARMAQYLSKLPEDSNEQAICCAAR
jgi:hypothetical protein